MEQKKKTYKCPHHYVKHKCLLCNRHLLCIHNKNQKRCIKCNLSLLCMHKKEKYSCILCKPYLLCPHNIRRHKCNECKIHYSKSVKINKDNTNIKDKDDTLCIHNNNSECMFCFLINFK